MYSCISKGAMRRSNATGSKGAARVNFQGVRGVVSPGVPQFVHSETAVYLLANLDKAASFRSGEERERYLRARMIGTTPGGSSQREGTHHPAPGSQVPR